MTELQMTQLVSKKPYDVSICLHYCILLFGNLFLLSRRTDEQQHERLMMGLYQSNARVSSFRDSRITTYKRSRSRERENRGYTSQSHSRLHERSRSRERENRGNSSEDASHSRRRERSRSTHDI